MSYLPAEWHTQSYIQLTWPHAGTDWKYMLEEVEACFLNLAREIASRQPLLLAAPEFPKALEQATYKSNIHFVPCPTNDTWARDHAFITLVSTTDASASCRLLDFRFNGWGEKFAADKDNRINRTLYDKGVFSGERVDYDDFVLEGGSIESDGRGTVLTTSVCLMAPHRNQPMTQAEVETVLKERRCRRR